MTSSDSTSLSLRPSTLALTARFTREADSIIVVNDCRKNGASALWKAGKKSLRGSDWVSSGLSFSLESLFLSPSFSGRP